MVIIIAKSNILPICKLKAAVPATKFLIQTLLPLTFINS